jgi:hypothetical protein
MLTFDEFVNKLKWTGVPIEEIVVGYFDRVEKKIVEIPRHRARYLKGGFSTLWDRR